MRDGVAPHARVHAVPGVRRLRVPLNTDGTVDKFIGDCIMAFWGAPGVVPTHTRNAVESLLAILAWIEEHPIRLPDGAMFSLRMGLHRGAALVGNFGGTRRWDYTAIGDVVNTAARLEPLNKQFGSCCLASSDIYDALEEVEASQEHFRPLGRFEGPGHGCIRTADNQRRRGGCEGTVVRCLDRKGPQEGVQQGWT